MQLEVTITTHYYIHVFHSDCGLLTSPYYNHEGAVINNLSGCAPSLQLCTDTKMQREELEYSRRQSINNIKVDCASL